MVINNENKLTVCCSNRRVMQLRIMCLIREMDLSNTVSNLCYTKIVLISKEDKKIFNLCLFIMLVAVYVVQWT